MWETLLCLLASRPWLVFALILAIPRGRAGFKAWLARHQGIDPGSLIYNDDVLALAHQARADGRPVLLVTGADQSIADSVAGHFDFFSEAWGSDGHTNLTRNHKTAALIARFGVGGYDYIGDSTADLPVWHAAQQAILVAPSATLLARARAQKPDIVVLGQRPAASVRARLIARALRPHQWAKNFLIFVPALAGHHTDRATLLACTLAFFAFSLLASSVYVLNDLLDLPHDRLHATKKNRPFASGALKLSAAPAMIAATFGGGLTLSLALPLRFCAILLVYYVATLAYSLRLKRLMVWDVITLAGLYTLRIFAGAAAIGGVVSPWLLVFSLFLFYCLAIVKRQTELTHYARAGKTEHISGRGYLAEDLAMLRAMAAASGYMAVLVLALYMNSTEVVALYRHPLALWALCPILLFWISRVLMLAHRGEMNDDPVVFALRDRGSLLVGAASICVIIAGLL